MFTVKDLLELKSFQGSMVVAGDNGLDNLIEDLCIMEVPDIEDYVKKGDFLLTTLYPIYNKDYELKCLIKNLSSAELSGIGIKLNRYIVDIPSYFIKQAMEMDFPIIILPEKSNFSMQINDYLKENNNRKNKELEYRNKIHNTIMDIMLKGSDYNELSKSLCKTINKNILVTDGDFNILGECYLNEGCKRNNSTIKTEEVLKKVKLSKEDYTYIIEEEWTGYTYNIQFGTENIGYIIAVGDYDYKLNINEKIAVEQFALAFRIIFQRQKEMKDLEQRYLEEFSYDLLFGKIDNNGIAINRANALGWEMTFPLSLMLLDVNIQNNSIKNQKNLVYILKSYLDNKYMISQYKLGYFFVNIGKYIVVFLDKEASDSYLEIVNFIEEALKINNIKDYYIGISQETNFVEGLVKCYWQGEKTIKIAKIINRERCIHFKNTGIYRIILGAENKEDLIEFCNHTIGPLIEYDKKYNSDLVETISVIIENNGNLKRTSEKMFVHYNTIRYRHKIIENLLSIKLDTIISYQDINLAIKIYDILKNNNFM